MSPFMSLLPLVVLALCQAQAGPVTFRDGVYNGFVVSIGEDVPATDCSTTLTNLEVAISSASATLRHALDGRATIGETVILLPDTWPDACVPPPPGMGPDDDEALPVITPSIGERPDISVQRVDPAYGALLYTQQSRGCGQPGDQIFLSHGLLEEPVFDLGKRLARELAKYRYGVFEENGYFGDPVYPQCYLREDTDRQSLSSCSDLPLDNDHTACISGTSPNLTQLVQPSARSSLMFASSLDHVDHFCDARTHDRLAPTKHNAMCGRRSIMEIINMHADFKIPEKPKATGNGTTTTTTTPPPPPLPAPSIAYKRQMLTRYVLVVEDTREMQIRDSWVFLRSAVRKWAALDLPVNAEAGLVVVNDSVSNRLVPMSTLSTAISRGLVSSNLPYSPGDSHTHGCLGCGVREALDMLEERAKISGPASHVIILLAPGSTRLAELVEAAKEAASQGVRISTINYPGVLRGGPLDVAADVTASPSYTVTEKGHNMVNSLLGTYFTLTNAFAEITRFFYQGHSNNLPVEVHRREVTDLTNMSGTFVLEEGLGAPARFAVYTHNGENPLIKGLTLISPSQRIYTTRSENLIAMRMLTVAANINETGTWQYKIDRFRGNPQSHIVQVTATPWSALTPVVRARFYTSTGPGPLVLFVQVSWGGAPVLGASVEVTASRPAMPGHGVNGTALPAHQEKFMLLDSGGGDPDVTRGDGIYSRYFSTLHGGAGFYTFEATVTDNGNTAYTWKENRNEEHDAIEGVGACCGSALRSPAVANLSPFQRILPALSMNLKDAATVQSQTAAFLPPGRVGDLRVEILAMAKKARLSWTAPDMGGLSVARYDIKYAPKLRDLMESFDTVASTWDYSSPFPLSAGSDTSFTMDLGFEPTLLDTPFFVALRAFPESTSGMSAGPISNWVRVLVPTPPPPPPTPTPAIGGPGNPSDIPPWVADNEVETDTPVPRLAYGLDLGLDLILPVVGGLSVLAICVAVYCYVCVVRRNKAARAKIEVPVKAGGLSPPGSQVVSPHHASHGGHSGHGSHGSHGSHAPLAGPDDSPDMDHKKRLSIAELHTHHEMGHSASAPHSPQHLSPSQAGPAPLGSPVGSTVVVSHTGSLQRPRTLSPYQSWTASQLLHEHERRHSPYGDEQALPAYQGYQGYGQYPQHTVDGVPLAVPQQYEQQYYPDGFHHSPPVPPLPHLRFEEAVYGMQSQGPQLQQQQQQQPQQQTHGFLHSNRLQHFNPSLQGSLSSVSSGDRKKRNVTMV